MKLGELDSKNPFLSMLVRVLLAIVVIAGLVAVFAEDELWVIVPITVVLAILSWILAHYMTKHK
jgi:hypothetical protein